MSGYESLKEAVIRDCNDRGQCGCFNPEGCNRKGAKIGEYGEPGFKMCFHKYCDKFKWVIDRAKEYGEKLGIPWEQILDAWEADRKYWYMNYYQECNQPSINSKNVRVFDTVNDLRTSIGEKGFRCPCCGQISTSPYECNSGAVRSDGTVCDWKVYGLLGDLGKGVFAYCKDKVRGERMFMPVAWEPDAIKISEEENLKPNENNMRTNPMLRVQTAPPLTGVRFNYAERIRTMKPLYIPKGRAKEYGDYAVNIYTGCPHRCYYCFAPNVLHRDREKFHSCVEPRPGIVDALKKQLEREQIAGKLIHLCFTCDPYPNGYDSSTTREIIKAIKASGNHVQILTKGDGRRDFDLLDENDWYGITYSGATVPDEPGALERSARLFTLGKAKSKGIKTWVSFEPVVEAQQVIWTIRAHHGFFDKVKIGKLNYWPSDIDWKKFGSEVETLCQILGLDYYIKDDLRKEMEKP